MPTSYVGGVWGTEFRTASWIVVAEPITDVDTTAADPLHNLDVGLNDDGVHLVFAELKDPVRRKIERYGLAHQIEPRHFFPTISAALQTFRDATGAQWTDPGQTAQSQSTTDLAAVDQSPPRNRPAPPSVDVT